MYVARLALQDFRSWSELELPLESGPNAFVGPNGHGKTNLVEAIDYVATLASHRVAHDGPLVRVGADQAIVRTEAIRDGRSALLEVEINPGKSNRARINRSPLARAREMLGTLRTVLFTPDDLTLVKGDPGDRRGFLDALMVLRSPRLAGERSDYDRILRQRNTLLKSAGRNRHANLPTLDIWDEHLARSGGVIMDARRRLLEDLAPHLEKAYLTVAASAAQDRQLAQAAYRPCFDIAAVAANPESLSAAISEQLQHKRAEELDRGISLIGPHRDDITLSLGQLPAKGYASHGESWSLALALKLAAFDLLRAEGDDPILILDDVFAELDRDRRSALAAQVADAEQVLVTAAVDDDVPDELSATFYRVTDGRVHHD